MASSRVLAFLLLAGCGENATFVARDGYQSPAPTPLACLPNLDGRLDPAEAAPAVGVAIRYLVSPAGEEREVDVAGHDNDEGAHIWDFSVDLESDQEISLAAAELGNQWYAGSFAGGAFVVPFDAGGRVEAVYHHDETAIWLHGLASADESPGEGQTLLVYEEPVAVLRFPVTTGASHTSTGTVVDGVLRGLPYAGSDTYEVSADALGVLVLPQLYFTETHRVRTTVTVTPAVGAVTTQRQVSFYFECFGEVTRAQSRSDETEADFSVASEVRRLGFR